MKIVSPSFFSLGIALLLHVALIALVLTNLSSSRQHPFVEPSLAIAQLVQLQAAIAPLPAPLPASPANPINEKKKTVEKSELVPKPLAPHIQSTTQTSTETRVSASMSMPGATSPESPAAPSTSTPIKTSVSIPASYAASNRKPEYPVLSRRYEEQGTVMLRVFVQADGTAGVVEIKSSSGYTLLDEAAKTAVQSWRFHPATNDGKTIAEWYQVPIPFTLQN